MNIIYYHPLFNAQEWLAGIKQRLPQAEIREWQRGDERPADYALVWRPPHEMLANRRDLKAVFALGAGVDAILDQSANTPARCPPACRCCGWRIPAWRSRCRNMR